MAYTQAELNRLTKDALVNIATDLQVKVENLSSGPLTGTGVEKAVLGLQQRAIDAKKELELAKLEYASKKEALTNEYNRELAELELEHKANSQNHGIDIATTLEALEKRVFETKDELDFGLKKKELEIKEATEKLEEKYKALTESAESTYKTLKEKLEADVLSAKEEAQAIIDESNAKVAKIKLENERTLENMAYEHKLAIRDKKIDTANKIAKEYSMVVVDEDEYLSLEDFRKSSEEEINARVESAVKEAESKLHAKYSSERVKYESESKLKTELLEKDKTYLSASITQLEKELENARLELAKVPGQIKEAVAAAKADVTINQDNKK